MQQGALLPPDGQEGNDGIGPFKIIFVCTGNICRSPLAQAHFEALLREEGLTERFGVDSAGTDGWEVGRQADQRMRQVARAHGVHIDHIARQLTRADIIASNLLLAMDGSNHRAMRGLARDPQLQQKIRLFREFDLEGGPGAEVPDPYYGGREGFEEVFRIVERTNRNLVAVLAHERSLRR